MNPYLYETIEEAEASVEQSWQAECELARQEGRELPERPEVDHDQIRLWHLPCKAGCDSTMINIYRKRQGTVTYRCQDCKGSWSLASGGSFDLPF